MISDLPHPANDTMSAGLTIHVSTSGTAAHFLASIPWIPQRLHPLSPTKRGASYEVGSFLWGGESEECMK